MPRIAKTTAEQPQVGVTVTMPSKPEPEKEPRIDKFDFWNYIQKLSPQDWNHHICYLYRTKPLVGQKQKERYLDVIAAPFTIDDIRKRFGGEEFRAMLIKDGHALHTEEFAIEASPKFDPDREAPTTTQRTDAITQQLLDKALHNDGGVEKDAMKRSIELLSGTFDTALSKIANVGAPNPDGEGGGTLLRAVLLKILDRNPMAEMLQMIQAMQAMGMMPKPGEAPAPSGGLSQLAKDIEAVKSLSEILGGGEGGGKRDLLSTLVERGPDLIGKAVEGLGKYTEIQEKNLQALRIKADTAKAIAQINANRAAAGLPPVSISEAPGASTAKPGAATATPQAVAGLPVVPMSDGNAPAGTPVAPSAEIDQIIAFLKMRVVQLIGEGKSGGDVIAFADDFQPEIVEHLESLDAAGLRRFFAEDPVLAQAIASPHWERWFAEACTELYSQEPEPEPLKN